LEQLTNLAGIYARQGYADSANLVFQQIIQKDPNNKPVLFNLGIAQVERARTLTDGIARYAKQANYFAEEYNKLAASGPSKKLEEIKVKQSDAIKNLNESRSSSQEAWGQAADIFGRLAGLDSTDYEAHYFFGLSLFWLEKHSEALLPLQHAVELKPDYCDAWQVYYFAATRARKPDLATEAKERFDSCGS
jgi:tetratricopeptide (TPR) repeat protein